jgi:hypothetical protein
MATRLDCSNCPRRYLDRTPEKLVIEGYRRWMGGYDTGHVECWEQAWDLYSEELGSTAAGPVLLAMADWVRNLRRSTARPMAFFPYNSCHLCRDECLAIAMVAASQHHDSDIAGRAAMALTSAEGLGDCHGACARFAAALDQSGNRLMRVPHQVLDTILGRPPRETFV